VAIADLNLAGAASVTTAESSALQSMLSDSSTLSEILLYVSQTCGIVFSRDCENQFRQKPVAFEFVTVDIATLDARILYMGFVDYARAKVLSEEVHS